MMLLGGVWKLPYFENSTTKSAYKLYSLVMQGAYFLACFSMCEEFVRLARADDIKELTFNIKITFPAGLLCFKLIVFQGGRFRNLLTKLGEHEARFASSHEPGSLTLYLACQKYVEKCSTAILALAGGTGSFLIVGTIVAGLTGSKDPDLGKPMMFLAHFHFDQNLHYSRALLLQTVTVLLSIIYFCLCPILYLGVLGFIRAELQVLQFRFRNFDSCKRRLGDVQMMKQLIQEHQFIIW